MKKRYLYSLSAALLLAGANIPAYADSKYFCAALTDEKTYSGGSGPKFLLEGKNNTAFRSETDFGLLDKPSSARKLLYKTISQELKNRGTSLVVLLLPPRASLMREDILATTPGAEEGYDPTVNFEIYKQVLEAINKSGAHAVALDNQAVDKAFYYKQDHHWSPLGAQRAAKITAELVKSLPEYNEVADQGFETVLEKKSNFRGIFSRFVAKKCKVQPFKEQVDIFKTTPTNTATDENALFGDETSKGYIALVGTSNSTEESPSNFYGWLRQNLQKDIRNFSISGSGPESLLAYIQSEDFKNNPPKVIVWESHPTYGNVDFESVMRRAIPQLTEPCTSKNQLWSGKATIPADNKKHDLISDASVLPPEYGYLHLKFDRPIDEKIIVEVNTPSGAQRERTKIDRKTGNDSAGEANVLISGRRLNEISTIIAQMPKMDKEVTVEMQFCPVNDSIVKSLESKN